MDALASAVEGVTPIFARQQHPRTLDFARALKDLRQTSPTRSIDEYALHFNIRNGPWDIFGFGYPLDSKAVPPEHPLQQFRELWDFTELVNTPRAPPGRGFYPTGMTDEEFAALGERGKIENSMIIPTATGIEVVLNERHFAGALQPVKRAIRDAHSYVSSTSLKRYLSAKLEELHTGSAEHRRASDIAWMQNTDTLDFVLSTGCEHYLDRYQGVRGDARGVVFAQDPKYTKICKEFLDLLPEMERQAPWTHHLDPENMKPPRLNFVNVLRWAGGYNHPPSTTIAQHLPNDVEIKDQYGSVIMVFVNIQQAMGQSPEFRQIREEFLPRDAIRQYGERIPDMGLRMTALHELGHAAGGIAITTEPHVHFGKEYAPMEEARAELFAMWALPVVRDAGLIGPEDVTAGYYSMVASLVKAMEHPPLDHSGARNMMFNYFLRHGGLVEQTEDGRTKYGVQPEGMASAVEGLLTRIADIRATGNREALEQLKGQYVTDSRAEFQRRMSTIPLGRDFIFPTLERRGRTYTGNVIYPAHFLDQGKSLFRFV